MAALPPPITATLRPSCTARRLATPSRNGSAGMHARRVRCRAGTPRIPSRCRSTGTRRRSRRPVRSAAHPSPTTVLKTNFTPRRLESARSRGRSTVLGQAVLGQGVAQHAAGLGVGFEDRDRRGPAAPGRRRRSGRPGPRPTTATLRPVGGSLRGGDLAPPRSSKASVSRTLVGDEAMHLAHVDRLVDGLRAGSGCRRDAGTRARWRPAADCP